MLTNLGKKYGWMMALSLLSVMNATPSLASPKGVTSPWVMTEPSTPEQIQPHPFNLDSILSGPEASRRISECYDNGLC